MKSNLAVMATIAIGTICAVGCGPDASNNTAAPTSTGSAANQPAPGTATNAAPDANAPLTASTNTPSATNTDPTAATNAPESAQDTAAKIAAEKFKEQMKKVKLDDPSGMGKDGWKKISSDPKAMTQAVEARMKELREWKMSMVMMVEMPVGRGMVNADNLIGDPTRYRLEYSDFQPGYQAHFETSLVAQTAEKQYSTFVNGAYTPGRVAPDPDVLNGWVLNSTHYLTTWVGTDKKPLTDLVTAAQKAKWKIGVEQKLFGIAAYQRIVMESNTKPVKRFELIIEPKLMLPTTFNAVVLDKKKTSSGLEIAWGKSDRPFTVAELAAKVKTDSVKLITPEQEAKMKAEGKGRRIG